ncbi:Signal peptide peptidase SppA (protease 4), partial [hydrothermal vent metagenome]
MKDFFKYTLATIVGITVVSIIGFFLFFMVAGVIISSTEQQATVSNNSLLILKLNRKIVDRAPVDPFGGLNIPGFNQGKKVGLNDILKSIEKASYDKRIKGIYLKLSVVNGGIATVEEIRNALKTFKEKCGKPIYAYADFYGQKAYYLASVADTIVINPQGAIDFRGLGGEMMFYKKALEKLGVKAQIVRHGKFKAAVEPFMLERMSNANREQTMTYLNSLWG